MQWRLGASSGNETRRRKEENNRLIELLFSAAAATLRWARFRPKTRRRGARSSIEPFKRPHPRIRTSLEEKQPKATKFSPQSAPRCRRLVRRRRPINAVLQAFGGSARNACLIWGLAGLKGVVVNERLGQQKPPSLPRLMWCFTSAVTSPCCCGPCQVNILSRYSRVDIYRDV